MTSQLNSGLENMMLQFSVFLHEKIVIYVVVWTTKEVSDTFFVFPGVVISKACTCISTD